MINSTINKLEEIGESQLEHSNGSAGKDSKPTSPKQQKEFRGSVVSDTVDAKNCNAFQGLTMNYSIHNDTLQNEY